MTTMPEFTQGWELFAAGLGATTSSRSKSVVAVCAVRTGCGRSQTSR
jgi:predicted GTPase